MSRPATSSSAPKDSPTHLGSGSKDAPKYKDDILPRIFTKRLCDVFDDELNRIAKEVGSRMYAFSLASSYGVTGTRKTIAHLPEIKLKPLLVPVPPLAERDETVQALDFSAQKTEHHLRTHSQLQDLFRTLLHDMMIAKTRDHGIALNPDSPK